MSAFTKADVRARAHRTWLFVLGIAGLLGAFVAIAGGVDARVLLLGSAWQLALLAAWNAWWADHRGSLRADEDGLAIGGRQLVARRRVRHVHVVTRYGVTLVRFVVRVGSVEVAVDDENEAAELLRAMRLDPSQSVAQYFMGHGSYRSGWMRMGALFTAGMLAMPLLAIAWLPALLLFLPAWYAALIYFVLSQSLRVGVGADGVHLRRFPFRSRFVPFGAIASAETKDKRDVVVTLRDGEVIRFHHQMGRGIGSKMRPDRADDAVSLVERIQVQVDLHRGGAADLTALARGERSTTDWMRDLARASDEHASFRANAIPPDTLWRVVEDPAAGTTARAGAALALRSRLDPAGRARLRTLADACAAPKLRVALESAASEDEAALEEAYDELEDERRA